MNKNIVKALKAFNKNCNVETFEFNVVNHKPEDLQKIQKAMKGADLNSFRTILQTIKQGIVIDAVHSVTVINNRGKCLVATATAYVIGGTHEEQELLAMLKSMD